VTKVFLDDDPGLNHFEIPEMLARPDGVLGRAALELMRLG
jgi:hypothetical protein